MDTKNGVVETHYSNGQLKSRETYKDDKLKYKHRSPEYHGTDLATRRKDCGLQYPAYCIGAVSGCLLIS